MGTRCTFGFSLGFVMVLIRCVKGGHGTTKRTSEQELVGRHVLVICRLACTFGIICIH